MRTDACERISSVLHRYVEGELRRLEATVVQEHLERCTRCRNEEAALRAEQLWLLENLLESPPLSRRLPGKVIRRIESARRKRSSGRAAVTTPSVERTVRWGVVAAVAAAIAVLVVSRAVDVSRDVPLVTTGGGERSEVLAATVNGGGGEPATATATATATLPEATRREPIAPSPRHRDRLAANDGNDAPAGIRTRDTVGASRSIPPPRRNVSRPGWRPTERLNLAHVVDMAHSVAQPERAAVPGKIPCEADPNDDGKLDLNDIAFSCQVILGPQSLVDALGGSSVEGESGSLNDFECEEDCLRV